MAVWLRQVAEQSPAELPLRCAGHSRPLLTLQLRSPPGGEAAHGSLGVGSPGFNVSDPRPGPARSPLCPSSLGSGQRGLLAVMVCVALKRVETLWPCLLCLVGRSLFCVAHSAVSAVGRHPVHRLYGLRILLRLFFNNHLYLPSTMRGEKRSTVISAINSR